MIVPESSSGAKLRSSMGSQFSNRLFTGLRNRLTRSDSNELDPWKIEEWRFPHDASRRKQLLFLLNFGILAPSVLNQQPWNFKVVGNNLRLYVDTDRELRSFDPLKRELTMSCGAALFHIRVAARHYGFEPVVRLFPAMNEPDLLAEISLGKKIQPTIDDERLFMAIHKRRTYRWEFSDQAVETAARLGLVNAALNEGVILTFVEDRDQANVAELIGEAEGRLTSDSAYQKEIASSDIPAVGSIESTDRFGSQGGFRARPLDPKIPASTAPALGIITTSSDTVPNWLTAGQAVDAVLLTASEYGLMSSFMNQPMHFPDTRQAIAEIVGQPVAQLIIRFGYGDTPPPTPREPLESRTL